MSRVDAIVLRRLGGRIILTLIGVMSLFMLLESLDYYRFIFLVQTGGLELALTSLFASASRWTLRTLSVSVLLGTIVGMLDLQVRHELNIIKSAGHSIWQVLRAPLVAVVIASLGVSLFLESASAQLFRRLNPTMASDTGAITPDGAFWLDQIGGGARYVMRASQFAVDGTVLSDVTVFLLDDPQYSRLMAPEARLVGNAWRFPAAVGYQTGADPVDVENYELPTNSTPADLKVRLASTEDLTFLELAAAMTSRLSDPILRNAVATRFTRLVSLPLTLAGSVLIGFAFTAGYRRSNKYGAAVLYGIVLGFVVYFVTEIADRAGSAGTLNPVLAATGPAFVAIVVGVTVLLYREDGRA